MSKCSARHKTRRECSNRTDSGLSGKSSCVVLKSLGCKCEIGGLKRLGVRVVLVRIQICVQAASVQYSC